MEHIQYMEKIKKKLFPEFEKFASKSDYTLSDLERMYKLASVIKNFDKIEMLEDGEGYSEARMGRGGSRYSYDDEMMYSERRGRGRNARRDSMGRYSSEGGSSYEDYPEDRMDGRYSRDDAKYHMMNKLGEMMSSADEEQREILKDAMRKIERA